jgi:hypothetical protein
VKEAKQLEEDGNVKNKNMKKIKVIVNNPLFKIALCLAVASLMIFEKMPLYSGIAVGIAIREFLLAFKK